LGLFGISIVCSVISIGFDIADQEINPGVI
jgi:hypothetical protein